MNRFLMGAMLVAGGALSLAAQAPPAQPAQPAQAAPVAKQPQPKS
jgi:hypothetical protein